MDLYSDDFMIIETILAALSDPSTLSDLIFRMGTLLVTW